MFRCTEGRSGPLSLQLPHWASLLFEILYCGCLRASFKLYLAFLALGRLTYKLLASVTGSGDALGGQGQGRGETSSSVSRLHGPLAPPPSQVHVALKQPRQAGDSDQKHNRGYQARTPGSCFPWYQINLIKTITVTVTCGFR